MPTKYIKSLSKKGKGSVKTLEKKWNRAKRLAGKQGHEEEYDYITGIFKRMIREKFGPSGATLLGKMGLAPNMGTNGSKNAVGVGNVALNKKKEVGVEPGMGMAKNMNAGGMNRGKSLGLNKEETCDDDICMKDIDTSPLEDFTLDIIMPFDIDKDKTDLVDAGELIQPTEMGEGGCACKDECNELPEKDLLVRGKYVFTLDDIYDKFKKGDVFEIGKDIMPKKKINDMSVYEIPVKEGEIILATPLFFEPLEKREITIKEDGGAGGGAGAGGAGGDGGAGGAATNASVSGETTSDVAGYAAPMKMNGGVSKRTAPDNGTNFKRTWDKVKSSSPKVRKTQPSVSPQVTAMLKSYKFD